MVNPKNLQFGVELEKILDIYTDDNFSKGDKEPLDGDEVDALINILKPQLNYMNGNITEKEYNLALEMRPSVRILLVPVSSINDSKVKFMLVRSNPDLRNTLLSFRKSIELLSLTDASFSSISVDTNTVLLTDKVMVSSVEEKIIHDKLSKLFDDVCVVDVTTEISKSDFNVMHQSNLNWNESTKIDVAEGGVYFTNRFETDFIESFALDYQELGMKE